jgi:hypothetical protein
MHRNVRPATEADALFIAENMKADDAAEVRALNKGSLAVLVKSAFHDAHTVLAWGPEGSPSAIFGVRANEGTGYVWSLSTPKIFDEWREVHRSTPAILDRLGRDFMVLANIKDARHRHHIRWLRSLGFTFINTYHLGEKQMPFHEFVRIQK